MATPPSRAVSPLTASSAPVDLDLGRNPRGRCEVTSRRFEWVARDIGMTCGTPLFSAFRDTATVEVTPIFADGHDSGSAFVETAKSASPGTPGRTG